MVLVTICSHQHLSVVLNGQEIMAPHVCLSGERGLSRAESIEISIGYRASSPRSECWPDDYALALGSKITKGTELRYPLLLNTASYFKIPSYEMLECSVAWTLVGRARQSDEQPECALLRNAEILKGQKQFRHQMGGASSNGRSEQEFYLPITCREWFK